MSASPLYNYNNNCYTATSPVRQPQHHNKAIELTDLHNQVCQDLYQQTEMHRDSLNDINCMVHSIQSIKLQKYIMKRSITRGNQGTIIKVPLYSNVSLTTHCFMTDP